MKQDTKDSIDRYVRFGLHPGDFVMAVLSNNLFEAVGRADDDNRKDLVKIVQYVYNDIPGSSWGSLEKVYAYMSEKHKEQEANNEE